MDRKRLFLVLTVLSLSICSTDALALTAYDLASQVSLDNYRHYIDNLLYTHTGDDRGYGPEHDLARSNIYNEFDNFGLDTSLEPFHYNGSTYHNVIGVHPGNTRPGDIYILGAHYDSFNNPGADDNASGTAGIMEAARILSQYDFEATLVFIGFDREEQGYFGSKAYVSEHIDDNILGMISVDMIAYNGTGNNRASIYSNRNSDPLAQDLFDAVLLYGNGITPVDTGHTGGSDHKPFQDAGFQAALFIENDFFDNSHYHKQTDSVDTLDYIDYAFATDMVRSLVGFAADAAVLTPEPNTIALLTMGTFIIFRRRKSNV